MGAMSMLGLAALLAGTAAATRGGSKRGRRGTAAEARAASGGPKALEAEPPTLAPPPVGRASSLATDQPVSTPEAISQNTADATQVAKRQRRRALAGHAGKATTGPASPGQRTVRDVGTPRTLVGY